MNYLILKTKIEEL